MTARVWTREELQDVCARAAEVECGLADDPQPNVGDIAAEERGTES